MLELKRGYDSNCKEKFIIKTDEGPFKIYYGSDLCLYWSCSASDDKKDFYHMVTIIDNVLYDKDDRSLDLYVLNIYKVIK